MRLHRFVIFVLACGTLLLTSIQSPTSSGAAAPVFATPAFEQVWSHADLPVAQARAARSWLWGPQAGVARDEPFATGTRQVQYFDKARMEVNAAAAAGSQWQVTTGLLVVELVSGRLQLGPDTYETRAPADVPVAGDATVPADLAAGTPLYRSFRDVASLPGGPDRRVPAATGNPVLATIDRAGQVGATADAGVRYGAYASETGHNIPDVFARFMATQDLIWEGGALRTGALLDPVYVLGYPISEAYWAIVPVEGRPTRVLVQLYQRRVLTYIPSFNAAWQVQMGNVGQHYYTWRYNTAVTPPPTAGPLPGTGDTFVHVSGNQFTYQGRPVRLKGTNFWLHTHAFVGTWQFWNGPVARDELAKAHELGVNTIRIGLPYDNEYTRETVWGPGCGNEGARCTTVRGRITNQMTQLLQIAASYDMKVLFTLFEWDDNFPAPGVGEYERQVSYLRGIVGPFANDDRVLGWDLHNEPENYAVWTDPRRKGAVNVWAANMAAVVHGLDAQHPVTIGMGEVSNLWASSDGPSLLDSVDFASFHTYDAGALHAQTAAAAVHTSKPLLLEEMGWPTGPPELSRPEATYDEATQQFLYRTMLDEAASGPLAGVIQWTLQDNPLGTPTHYIKPTYESWFGLVRLDGSFKPAATDFRDRYPVPPLPSRTHTDVPLTRP
ncbi:MAG TPA: cellulase family glycosylhydrolase [Chloroflexia bacterium]|nr:cellulase family glycosylhydrolase [Chloroflexia bacterium]